MTSTILGSVATVRPPRMEIRRPPKRKPPSDLPRLVICAGLAFSAGGLHAAGWLFPGAWLPAWAGQAALIALGLCAAPRRALILGSLAGAIGIAASFYWGVAALRQTFDASPLIAWPVFTLLVSIEALGFGTFCWSASHCSRRGLQWMWIVPCVWVVIEEWFPRVFPWRIGYSQLEFLQVVQVAELVGSGGIGFILTAVAAVPSALFLGFRQNATLSDRRWASGYCVSAIMLLAASLAFGEVRARQWDRWCATQPRLKVALIQVDPAYVGSEKKLREKSLAVHDQVDLVCWPESAAGVYSETLAHFRDREETMRLSRHSLRSLEPAKGFASHLLSGGKQYRPGADEAGPYSMTAFLISPAQDILGRYRKRTLLPFGEYIPGQRWYPALREWATLREIYEAGNDSAPLVTTTGDRLGVVICYEDTLARNARRTVTCGAEVLVSLIQGTAFDNPLTLVRHQRLAVLRAVENRRYLVRCSSTGVSCVVAPSGRMVAQLPVQQDGVLLAEIALARDLTWYSRFGEWFPTVCAIVAMIGLATGWLAKRSAA